MIDVPRPEGSQEIINTPEHARSLGSFVLNMASHLPHIQVDPHLRLYGLDLVPIQNALSEGERFLPLALMIAGGIAVAKVAIQVLIKLTPNEDEIAQ